MVTVDPLTVQTPVVSELYVTAFIDVPPTAPGLIPKVAPAVKVKLGGICAPKVIVWPAFAIVTF